MNPSATGPQAAHATAVALTAGSAGPTGGGTAQLSLSMTEEFNRSGARPIAGLWEKAAR